MQGMICKICRAEIQSAVVNGVIGLKCDCSGPPVPIKPEHPVKERFRRMTNQDLEKRDPDKVVKYQGIYGDVSLAIDTVQTYFCEKATPKEAVMFMRFCQHYGLDPWNHEVYGIKYDASKPMALVIGKNAYTSRASMRPEYRGIESGVIVLGADDEEKDIEGMHVPKGYSLVGGWAKVHRSDLAVPIVKKVSLSEYNTGFAEWKNKPATMINKVAIVQATRDAFPDMFANAFVQDVTVESVDEETGEIIES